MIISPEFHRQLWRGNLLGVIIAMAVMALFFLWAIFGCLECEEQYGSDGDYCRFYT